MLPAIVLGITACQRHVVVSSRPRPESVGDEVCWVVVPEVVWTAPEGTAPQPSLVSLPFPVGSAENRFIRRSRARRHAEAIRRDGAIFNDLLCWTDWKRLSGAFVARPKGSRVALEVLP